MPPKILSDLLKTAGKALAKNSDFPSSDKEQSPNKVPQASYGQTNDSAKQRAQQDRDAAGPRAFQHLVKNSRSIASRQAVQPSSFAEISEALQRRIADKLKFDSSVSNQKQKEILTSFYDILSNPETPSIVSDSFLAAATRNKMTEIEVTKNLFKNFLVC